MKTELIVCSVLATVGWVAVALGHTHHLFFTAVPCTVLAAAGIIELIREKKRKSQTTKQQRNDHISPIAKRRLFMPQ